MNGEKILIDIYVVPKKNVKQYLIINRCNFIF